MKDAPMPPGAPALPGNEQNAVMHMSLPILAGIVLQGTDMLESMGRLLGDLPRQIRHPVDVQLPEAMTKKFAAGRRREWWPYIS